MPEPDWLWSASCDVELRFVESAFESALFDWSTEPSLPGLQTRTGSLELPPELQPHSDSPKSWNAPEADSAAWPLTQLCPSTWMPMPPPQPHGLPGDD